MNEAPTLNQTRKYAVKDVDIAQTVLIERHPYTGDTFIFQKDREADMTEIQVLEVDITTLSTDAIVNAANPSLLGGGGVDGAIHRAAGPELVEYCRTLSGCVPGEARITPGFKLPARYIIHTVGPVWHGGNRGEPAMLTSCYKRCLNLTAKNSITSIAFPAISCGVYGYPYEAASKIAVEAVCNYLTKNDHLDKVIFACFSEEMVANYRAALAARTL